MNNKREGSFLRDSKTMFIRCMMLAMRSPEAVVMILVVPFVLMIVFVYVFAGVMDLGDISVINFIVPGIILQTIGQGIPSVAVRINNDMTKGVINRFRTMPISKSSILVGHVLTSVVMSIVTVTATIGAAILMGFRPLAGLTEWLMVAGIIILYLFMMSWLAVLSGVFSKEPESAAGYMSMVGVLPFLSSGFVPTENMPLVLRVFAENQPMTPIINTVRALFLGYPIPEDMLRLALMWCIGLAVLFYVLAFWVYNRKTAR